MTPEDEEFNRIERESDMRLRAVSAALEDHRQHLKALRAAARPSVPDMLTASEGETADYVQGWNDCRAEMLKGMKP